MVRTCNTLVAERHDDVGRGLGFFEVFLYLLEAFASAWKDL